jgi:site-specific DNA recombinase
MRFLCDPSAKGLRRANYTQSQGDGKNWKFKSKEDWVFTQIEPIVSEDLWNQCQAVIEDQIKHHKRPSKRVSQLFAGFTFCQCGDKMYVPSTTPKYVCHKCRNKISIQDLEGVFHEQLKSFFFSPKEISKYLEGADKVIKDKQELIASQEKEHEKVKTQMDRIMQLYLDSQITGEGFKKEYGPLEVRLKQIGNQLPELQGEIDFLKIKLQSSDQILSEAKDLYGRWNELAREEKRNIIEQITEKIVIGKGEITIDLCYLPASTEIMANEQHNLRDCSQL